MTGRRAVGLVAGREIRERLRSRALVAVTLVLAAVLAVVAAIPGLVAGGDGGEVVPSAPDAGEVTVGVLGDTDGLDPDVVAALAAALGGDPELVAVDDVAAATNLLAEGRVGFVLSEDGTRLLAAASDGPFGAPVPTEVTEALGLVRALDDVGGDPADVAALLSAPPAEVEIVATGTGVDPATAAGRFGVAYAGALLLYFALIFFANLMSTGVIQEKGSRVVELLLPAVPARQLMAGKVLGLGTVGTLQTATIVTPALVVVLATGGEALPPGLWVSVVAVIVAFVLGYGLYAGVTAGLSALVSRVEDAQVALFPLYAILVGAFILAFPVLNAPDTTLAQVATFVPFTAPFVVPARIALVDLPLWQAGLSALGVVVTTVVSTRIAARLFEGAILRGGARVRLRAAWRGARD